MQHGALDFVGASRAILAVAIAGRPAIVRAPVGDFASASRLLDAGAAGVIAPMINSRADAERFAVVRQVSPARGAVMGAARGAAAQRARLAPLSRVRQRTGPGDRHDRDPRGAGGARRHSRRRGDRRRVHRPSRPLDRAEQRRQMGAARPGGPRGGAAASSPAPAPTASTPACSVTTAPTPRAMAELGFKLCSVGSDVGPSCEPPLRPNSRRPAPIGDRLWKNREIILDIISLTEATAAPQGRTEGRFCRASATPSG